MKPSELKGIFRSRYLFSRFPTKLKSPTLINSDM